jgi:hypothetical protein
MGDDVKPKSLCCSYNTVILYHLVIKQAEGNNKQTMSWKVCVVEQNVQC